MPDEINAENGQPTEEPAQPNPDLQTLSRLIGTWEVSGEAEGTVTYEWTENGSFLLQHVELGGSRGRLLHETIVTNRPAVVR